METNVNIFPMNQNLTKTRKLEIKLWLSTVFSNSLFVLSRSVANHFTPVSPFVYFSYKENSCYRWDRINLLKPTGYVTQQRVQHSTILLSAFCSHKVFKCFVFIPEQIATFAPYNINLLVFMKEMKSVYSAVRTGSLNKAVCACYVMHHQFNIQQLYALPTLYLCVLYLSENKQRLVPLTA